MTKMQHHERDGEKDRISCNRYMESVDLKAEDALDRTEWYNIERNPEQLRPL